MTDDLGTHLRSAAAAAAARSVRPPVTAIRRRLVRRRVATGSAVVLVAAVVVAGATALEPRSSLRPTGPASLSATATRTPYASPSATPAAAALPTIVASRGDETEDQPLVFLSPVTGRVLRSMHVGLGDQPLGHPWISYDRSTIYFVRVTTSCSTEIVSVPSRGGPDVIVANGYAPRVSRDGRRLAYLEPADACSDKSVLVVRDLGTGTERRWNAGAGEDIVDLDWAPDSTHLAVIRQVPRPSAEATSGIGSAGYFDNELWILDTQAPGASIDTGHQVPGVKGWCDAVTYRGPEGTLVVLALPGHGDYPSVLSEIDPDTGHTKEVVRFPHPVNDFDYDASGQHLIYVWNDTLYRWVDGRSVRLAGGINSAAW